MVRQGAPLAGASPAGWCCAMTCALPATLTECLCKPPPVPRCSTAPCILLSIGVGYTIAAKGVLLRSSDCGLMKAAGGRCLVLQAPGLPYHQEVVQCSPCTNLVGCCCPAGACVCMTLPPPFQVCHSVSGIGRGNWCHNPGTTLLYAPHMCVCHNRYSVHGVSSPALPAGRASTVFGMDSKYVCLGHSPKLDWQPSLAPHGTGAMVSPTYGMNHRWHQCDCHHQPRSVVFGGPPVHWQHCACHYLTCALSTL